MTGSHRQQPSAWTTRWVDAALILGITAFIAFLSGAQRWTGFNSPDSEFYASLALFGHEVADRALEPAYTWTRLGYIAPVHGLTSVFGVTGFLVWRFALILLVTGSMFCIARMQAGRPLAVIAATMLGLNTVVLSFLGNSYLTGTIVSATMLLLALGVWGSLGKPRQAWLPTLLAGLVAGWLLMLNPYACMLGMSMWAGIRVVALVRASVGRWGALGRDIGMGLLGVGISLMVFLGLGELLFPGRNWFETYVRWNDRLDYASFIGDASAWQHDIALLVPVTALLISAWSVAARRHSPFAWAALAVSIASIAFTAVFYALVPGPWLESPTYVAKLWSGALVTVVLAWTALWEKRRIDWGAWVVAALAIPLLIWAGHWDKDVNPATGLAIALLMILATIAVTISQRWPVRLPSLIAGIGIVAAVFVFAIGSEVLQNGRGLVGSYGQFPFRAAFVDFDAEMLMQSRITAEEFVLANTTADDRIGIWADPERLTAGIAAMQLWGKYNLVGGGATLTSSEADQMRLIKPTVIAMYAPHREQVDAFYASLPTWSVPSPLECTAVPFLGIGSPDATVCVTHLRW